MAYESIDFCETCDRYASPPPQVGIVVHEIGHALGFYHEQSRADRDDYVYINTENIQKDYRSNFDLLPESKVNSYNVTYDLSSIMHYDGKVGPVTPYPCFVPCNECFLVIATTTPPPTLDLATLTQKLTV